MSFSSQIKDCAAFAKANYKYYFFICLFFSLLIAQLWFNSRGNVLHNFNGRAMGEATVNGVDVGKRVSAFYTSGAIFFICNVLFYFLFYFLFRKKDDLKWLQLPNILSIAGSLTVFFNAMDYVSVICTQVLLGLVLCSIIFVLVKKKLISELNSKLFDQTLFVYLVCFSFFLFFLVGELFSIKFDLDLFLPLAFVLIFSGLVVSFRKNADTYQLQKLGKCFFICFPIALLPLASVIKTEVFMILNGKNIFVSPLLIYFLLLIVLTVWIVQRYFWFRKRGKAVNIITLLHKQYLPWFIVGVSAFVYYDPFYTNISDELFEKGNRFLPVMEFYKFDLIPMVQKFNSHLLSDFVTIYLYSLFNKLEGMGPMIYDFIFPTISALISFVVLRDLSRNYLIALFVALLFPFTEQLIPLNFSIALLGIYSLKKFIFGARDLKAHLWLFVGIFFLVIWKIDIGFGALFGFASVFLAFLITGNIRVSAKVFTKSLGIFLSLIVIFSIFFYFMGINVLTTAKDYLSHISASQSYGFSSLLQEEDERSVLLFNVHHYAFPVLVMSIAIYVLFNLTNFVTQRKTRFAAIAILFSVGFYLGNFQRGLVRHGFMEHTDLYLSSFVFFIFGAFIFLFFQKRSQKFKFLSFTVLTWLFISGFKYDEIEPQNLLSAVDSKEFVRIEVETQLSRELDAEVLEEKYKPFKEFVNQELAEDETFIDFSNTPMFYYFTGKETPSFFFQNPICMHNDHLQNRFLEELKNYKTPIVLFSRSHQMDDQWGWDFMDNVPNPLRHYRIAEYLYNHYEPFTIVKDHCVWRRKGRQFKKPDSSYEKDHYSDKTQAWNIGLIPYLWANYDAEVKNALPQHLLSKEKLLLIDRLDFDLPQKIDKGTGNYIYVELESNNESPEMIRLVYGPGYGQFDFTLPRGKGIRSFAVRISAQYNWHSKENESIGLQYNGSEHIFLRKMSILKGN